MLLDRLPAGLQEKLGTTLKSLTESSLKANHTGMPVATGCSGTDTCLEFLDSLLLQHNLPPVMWLQLM